VIRKSMPALFGSLLTLVVVFCNAVTATADHLIIPVDVLPASDEAVVYTMKGDIQSPRGAQHSVQQLQLTRKGDGSYDASLDASGTARQRFGLALVSGRLVRRAANGAANTGGQPGENGDKPAIQAATSTISTMNVLVAPTMGAPTTISQGDTWTSLANLAMPGGDEASVSLAVTARSVFGQDVQLTSRGRGNATFHVRGQAIKVEIVVDMSETFRDGRLFDAVESHTMSAKVLFRTMSLTEKWTVSTT
jgi:hypothetical protein